MICFGITEKRFSVAIIADLIIQSEEMVDGLIFAFTYAKGFAITFRFYFSPFPSRQFSRNGCQEFFANVSSFTQEA